MLGENVHKQISGANRKDARPLVRSLEKGRFNGVNRVNVTGDARDTIFIRFDDPSEMPVRFVFEPATVDDMEFFAWF